MPGDLIAWGGARILTHCIMDCAMFGTAWLDIITPVYIVGAYIEGITFVSAPELKRPQ